MHNPHELLPFAYRAAATVTRCHVLAEEAGERALHLLTLALLDGTPPRHPRAWLRVVARRSACALLRSEGRTRRVSPSELHEYPAHFRRRDGFGVQFVREHLAPRLTVRQREALDAALSCNTTHSAARSCGMPPRDFRRYLDTISRRARAILREDGCRDAPDASQAELGL